VHGRPPGDQRFELVHGADVEEVAEHVPVLGGPGELRRVRIERILGRLPSPSFGAGSDGGTVIGRDLRRKDRFRWRRCADDVSWRARLTSVRARGRVSSVVFVKWVTCAVDARRRQPFSTAQQRWAMIADQPGLIGQVGGWSLTGDAQILALWTDAEAYTSFMGARHDAVVDAAAQRGTYRPLTTSTGAVILSVPGEAASVGAAIGVGTVLRVADCEVHEGRDEHFMEAQRTVWAPGMSAAGVLGGVFAVPGEHRYLVATWWPDLEAYDRYARDDVPRLRQRADAAADLRRLSGYVIMLEPTWQVVGARRSTTTSLDQRR